MTTKYTVRDTGAGYAVVRAYGMYAEFLSRDEAESVASCLASGHADETDYDWTNWHRPTGQRRGR